ncbi:MAG: six-hairpin glycosidase-like protein [Saprospiraceae bacterium]
MTKIPFFKNCLILFFLILSQHIFSQKETYQNHWEIGDNNSIIWDLKNDQNLPHQDNIEMAGTRVAGIISYKIDTAKNLKLERQIFFPQIHPIIKETDPNWFIYRAYAKETFGDESFPTIIIGDRQFVPGPIDFVKIDGLLTFQHQPSKSGLALKRELFPSTDQRLFIEKCYLTNTSDQPIRFRFASKNKEITGYTKDDIYLIRQIQNIPSISNIAPGKTIEFSIEFNASRSEEDSPSATHFEKNLTKRKALLKELKNSLQLNTPNPILNQLFEFSKIRASESIFESKLGLIHSPGGGRYYVGIWANDQAEYVNPFFPYLGYDIGNESAMNTYRAFAKEINPEFEKIRYAFEIEGEVPPFLLDRGDAAMIAYGASHFALANGDKKIAEELWPLIEWCLEYCHRQLNEEGVVKSESDEMEGRIETGTANLSTSALYFGALEMSQSLAKSLGKKKSILDKYEQQYADLKIAIDQYFGAKVEGLETYKYYKEHQFLRHWICLPLVVGIFDRKEETVKALFEKLWSTNGVHVEKNSANKAISKIFWDRGTLYALRGTFFAGATEVSLEKLTEFSKERLLGKRVPYVVEAFPEGNMAHLSAESALYCRVFTEGMFGIVPTGLKSFKCTPRLPKDWNFMELNRVKAFGEDFNIKVFKLNNQTIIKIENNFGKVLLEKTLEENETVEFTFK